MGQSRNLTRTMKEIESIYDSVLQEKYEHKEVHHQPEDVVPLAPGTGPDASKDSEVEEIDPAELSEKENEENAYEPAKFSQNSGKVKSESVNNSTMEDNIFDKLYKTVMESEDPMAMEADDDVMDDFGADDAGDADVGGEETVSVKLSPAHVEALLDLLAQVEEQVEDDEADDLGDIEDVAADDDDALVAEAPVHAELKAAPSGDELKGKNNKVKGKLSTTDSGHADHGKLDTHADLKPAADGVAKLTGKDNKVGHVKHIGD
jgi:hypothetical protein